MRRGGSLAITAFSVGLLLVMVYFFLQWYARRDRYNCVAGTCVVCTSQDWKHGTCSNMSKTSCEQQCGFRCNAGACEPCKPGDTSPCMFSEHECLSSNGFKSCGYTINGADTSYQEGVTRWAETCTSCDGESACDNYPNGACGGDVGYTCSQENLGMCVKCSDQSTYATCEMHASRLDEFTCGVNASIPCPIYTCYNGTCQKCVHGLQSLNFEDEYNCYMAINGDRTAFYDSTCGGGMGCNQYYCQFNGTCAACDLIDPDGRLGLCGPTALPGVGDGTTYNDDGTVHTHGVKGTLERTYCDDHCEQHVRWFCDNATRTCKTTTPENGYVDSTFDCADGMCNWFESESTCQSYCSMQNVCESTEIPVLRDSTGIPEMLGAWAFHSSMSTDGIGVENLANFVQIPYNATPVLSNYEFNFSRIDNTDNTENPSWLNFDSSDGVLSYYSNSRKIWASDAPPGECLNEDICMNCQIGVRAYGILYLQCTKNDGNTEVYWQTNGKDQDRIANNNTVWAEDRGIGDQQAANVDRCYQANMQHAYIVVQHLVGWGLAVPVFGEAMGYGKDTSTYDRSDSISVYNHFNGMKDATKWNQVTTCEDISLADLKQHAGYGDNLMGIMPDNSVVARLPRLKCSQVYAQHKDSTGLVMCRGQKAACVADNEVDTIALHEEFALVDNERVVRAENLDYAMTFTAYNIPGGPNSVSNGLGEMDLKPAGLFDEVYNYSWGQVGQYPEGCTGGACISLANGTTVPLGINTLSYIAHASSVHIPDPANFMQVDATRVTSAYPIVSGVHTVLVSDDGMTHLGVYAAHVTPMSALEYEILDHIYFANDRYHSLRRNNADTQNNLGKGDVVLRTQISPNTWVPLWVGGVNVGDNSSFELKTFNEKPALAVVEHNDDFVHWMVDGDANEDVTLFMDYGGDLILSSWRKTIWTSNTGGNPNAYAKLDCRAGEHPKLLIYRENGTLIENYQPTIHADASGDGASNGTLGEKLENDKFYAYNYSTVLLETQLENPTNSDTLKSGRTMTKEKCLTSGPCKLQISSNGALQLIVLKAALLLGDDHAEDGDGAIFATVSSRALIVARTQSHVSNCEDITYDMLETDKDLFCENAYVQTTDFKQKCTTRAYACDYENAHACLPTTAVTPPTTQLDVGDTATSCACMSSCDLSKQPGQQIAIDSYMMATFAFDYTSDINKDMTGYAIGNAEKYCVPHDDYNLYTFNDSTADSIIRFTTHGGLQDPNVYSGITADLTTNDHHGIEENPILMTYFGMCDYYAQKIESSTGAALVVDPNNGCGNAKSKWSRIDWSDIIQYLGMENIPIPPKLGCCTTTADNRYTSNTKNCLSGYEPYIKPGVGLPGNAKCCRQDPYPHAGDQDYLRDAELSDTYWLACRGCYWTEYKGTNADNGNCIQAPSNPADGKWRGWENVGWKNE